MAATGSRGKIAAIAAILVFLPTAKSFLPPGGVLRKDIPSVALRTSTPPPLCQRAESFWAAAAPRQCQARGSWRSASRRLQQAGPGPSEGDEGIADLESLTNPAKDKEYGDDKALQYGVSSVAAGASDQFFSADTRVVFGVNALEIGLIELFEMGLKRAFIVTGWNQARADPIVWELLPRGFELGWHSVSAEPSLSDVAEGASLALKHRADCVVAVGGAAVIDGAKAIAAIAYADTDHKRAAKRLLAAAYKPREDVPDKEADGEGNEADAAPLLGPIPLVAVPLVAGLGSEITPMATILDDADPLEPKKVTVGFHNSAAAMPAPFMAIVEPRLMMRVPLETTWPRAFVALAGCLDGYVAGRGFVPDLLSHQGVERVAGCLSRGLGFRGPLYGEREDIAFAGIIRGLVASRTEWGFLHQLASAVAVTCGAPYAVCVARLFPRVLGAQLSALRKEESFVDPTRRRRGGIGEENAASPNANAHGGVRPTDDGDSGESAHSKNDKIREGAVEKGVDGVGGTEFDERFPSGADTKDASDAAVDQVSDSYSDRPYRSSSSSSTGEERNDRARAVLLKYWRLASIVIKASTGGDGSDRNRQSSSSETTPEDMVTWLDERLLDKNIDPLYRTGLRPDHMPGIMEALLAGGEQAMTAAGVGTADVWGGLGEEAVKTIISSEATRRSAVDRDGMPERAERGEGLDVEQEASSRHIQTGPFRK